MRILWISNTLFPDICDLLNISRPYYNGWVYSTAKCLISNKEIVLGVAAIYNGSKLKIIDVNNIRYFLIPLYGKRTKYNSKYESIWNEIKASFKPEIIHIHGTEFPLGLSYIKTCGNKRVVVSIQGLVSVIERYMYAGIPGNTLLRYITPRDILHSDSAFHLRNQFKKRGLIEKEYIRSINHIIGRTQWDKAHIWALNPKANYHYCNETLRESFYIGQWELLKCEKYTIFISQATYPIKGLQIMLKAMPLILREFPKAKLYIAGKNFVNKSSIWERITIKGYARYILSLINNLGLENHVSFTGILPELEMRNQYLKSHVFVCPSSIENSPNSLGEAQILGVPSVASYVGGIPDMVKNDSTLLYRFEEYEMLAKNICSIFADTAIANQLSINSITEARKRHDREKNIQDLQSIYNKIIKD